MGRARPVHIKQPPKPGFKQKGEEASTDLLLSQFDKGGIFLSIIAKSGV